MYIQYNIYIYIIHISTGPEFLNHELTGCKGHALNSCLLKKKNNFNTLQKSIDTNTFKKYI